MDAKRWQTVLEHIVGQVRCATCKTPYGPTAMTAAGAREQHHFIRCHCERCGTDALAVIIVQEIAVAATDEREETPLTEDDVMDAAALMGPARVTLSDLGIAA